LSQAKASQIISFLHYNYTMLIRYIKFANSINSMDLVQFLEKNKKTSHLDCNGHIEGDIMQNHELKKRVKKSGNPRFYGPKELLS
jgi:hypothetical protein